MVLKRRNPLPEPAVHRNAATRGLGLFVVGTDTGVGKTHVAACIARALVQSGKRVGVYKPAASGCETSNGRLISDDAIGLWNAAGQPGELDAVCPQKFAAPLAPHLAAREEGKRLDPSLLRSGLAYWQERSDVVIVEGAGGLMSPLGDDEYVADLAADFGFPLVVVAANKIGVINQTLQTLMASAYYAPQLPIAGIVLNDAAPLDERDPSTASNRQELEDRCSVPVLAHLRHRATSFDEAVDWLALAHRTN